LSALESQIAAYAATEPRAVGLITRVIQKAREQLR
jgi:hypothetical protein